MVKMKVELLESSEDPEQLVCKAARNDYRSEGVIDYSWAEIIEDIDADDLHLEVTIEKWGDDLISNESNPILEAKKRTLIDHLIDSGHWGPFEHPQATIAIDGVSRVLMAQITRHRHFTFDVMSLRYVELDDENTDWEDNFQFPNFLGEDYEVDREGVHEIEDAEDIPHYYEGAYDWAKHYYNLLLSKGVPQEEARKVLPMGTKVNMVVSANARAWMHILNVRTKADVQGETRRCAEKIFEELKEWMPYTMEKYDEDVLPLRLNP